MFSVCEVDAVPYLERLAGSVEILLTPPPRLACASYKKKMYHRLLEMAATYVLIEPVELDNSTGA